MPTALKTTVEVAPSGASVRLLDHASTTYRRGKPLDNKEAKRIATVLRGVADDIEP